MGFTPHPSESARIILFLDANMPSIRECRERCKVNIRHMCIHRFGPLIWLCAKPLWVPRPGDPPDMPPTKYNRLRDVEVAQWWISVIRCRWRDIKGGIQQPKRYVLLTHDENFVADAEKEHRKGHGDWTYVPEFYPPKVIRSGEAEQEVFLEVHVIPVLDRDHDIRRVLEYARSLV